LALTHEAVRITLSKSRNQNLKPMRVI